jgi:hypothetical protein
MAFERSDSGATYEIRVQGELGQDWQEWFSGLAISSAQTGGQPVVTTLIGPVADQSALRGVLCKLWDLNLTLLTLRRIKAERRKETSNG